MSHCAINELLKFKKLQKFFKLKKIKMPPPSKKRQNAEKISENLSKERKLSTEKSDNYACECGYVLI